MTVREQIIKEVVTTEDSQLLQDVLHFLQRRARPGVEEPRKGSYEAFMRYRGTLSDEDAEEMMDIINREFNTIEGEW